MSIETVQDLVVAADMLQIEEVVLVCGNFIKKELCPSNAVSTYRQVHFHFIPFVSDNELSNIAHFENATILKFSNYPSETLN